MRLVRILLRGGALCLILFLTQIVYQVVDRAQHAAHKTALLSELHTAFQGDDAVMVRRVMSDEQLRPYFSPLGQRTLMFWAAARAGRPKLATMLLADGVDPRGTSEIGCSAIRLFASNGYQSLVQEMLHRGADPNRQDASGDTPLAAAMRCALPPDEHPLRCFVSGGGPPFQDYLSGPQAVRLLIEAGARPNLANKHGQTAMSLLKEHERRINRSGCQLVGGMSIPEAKRRVRVIRNLLTGKRAGFSQAVR